MTDELLRRADEYVAQEGIRDPDVELVRDLASALRKERAIAEANYKSLSDALHVEQGRTHRYHERAERAEAALRAAHIEATSLVTAMAEQAGAPAEWRPLSDVAGMVTQISNMAAGLRERAKCADADRNEWKEKWRWERSHGCPDWGNHTSDGRDRVCWHRLPESWHDLLKDRDSARAERDSLRALLRGIRQAAISHVDGRDLFAELHLPQAHFTDIHVRINGQWKKYEGDWLKKLGKAVARIDALLAKDKS